MNIPFFKAHVDEKEIEFVNTALSDHNSNMTKAFELDIINFFGTKHAISTNNGTSAMHLALCAMDIKRGDKIICSVNAFPNVAEVIRHFDAEPIFVDINEDDFNINPSEFERVAKENQHKKLKCAFINHVAGQSAEMDEIYDIAEKYNIKIIDEASRAMGATYNGVKIGSNPRSYASCFQINPQAQDAISTAGFFTTNDDKLASRARLLRNHAIVSNGFYDDGNLKYIYDVSDIGQKYDLNSINAGFARAQLMKTKQFLTRRIEIANLYAKELENCSHITLPVAKKPHIYFQYIIKIDKNRDDFARRLAEVGIMTSLHYIPLYLLSYYKHKYNYKTNAFPVALRVYQQVLSLPIYAALSDEEVLYVCKQIKKIADSRA